MASLSEKDDHAHEPDAKLAWRESYYFNWVDLKRGISGFSTVGLLPNANKREFVFALFYDNERETYWEEPDGAIPTDFRNSLSFDRLSFEMIEPLKEWRIKYILDHLEVDIKWKARFPAYDFGGGSGTSWNGHFEQSGFVEGSIKLPTGPILAFKGYGERDKSWGSRDWHIEAWYAFHAQFKDISFGLRRDQVKGEFVVSGGISTVDGHVPIEKVDVDTEYVGSPQKIPYAATTTIHGADESQYTIKSKTLSPKSFVRFERAFQGGSTELFENMAHHYCEELDEDGTGLLEWLFTYTE